MHRQLTEATDAWESVYEDQGWLYRGTRLAIAREWAARQDSELSQRERRFLDASLQVERAEQELTRRRARRLRQLVALLAVLLLFAVGATVYAVNAQSTATSQRNNALAQKVAGQALALHGTDPALASQLALAAYRIDPTPETLSSVLGMFASPFSTRLTGHTGRINTVALRPDGQVLASASWDGTARLWAPSPGTPGTSTMSPFRRTAGPSPPRASTAPLACGTSPTRPIRARACPPERTRGRSTRSRSARSAIFWPRRM